jgi:predicted metal-dependent phosphoesterase TrpH
VTAAEGQKPHRIDLHCHTSASFDGRVDPLRLVQLARERGLTHLAITDHETLDGVRRAGEVDTAGVTVIIGQEARSTEGDMIALFIEQPVPSGLTPEQTAQEIRAQGGLVGLPHPFDTTRPSIGRGAVRFQELSRLALLADYVEVHNGRVRDPRANELAADLARDFGLPAVAVSDAHTEPEVGWCATVVNGPLHSAAQLLAALRNGTMLSVREPQVEAEGFLGQLRNRLGRT